MSSSAPSPFSASVAYRSVAPAAPVVCPPVARPPVAAAGPVPEVTGARARRFGLVLGVLAALLIGVAYTQSWWSFLLYAPQYPNGLGLQIKLSGLTGDVSEIDTLNHYIGMARLSQAASLERAIAGHAVALIAIALLLGLFLNKRWLALGLTLPALTLPLAFLADTFYWLYRFGHTMDPRAPLKIAPFTPELFGNGTIGQFMSFAEPESGFWLAATGAVLAGASLFLRFWRPKHSPARNPVEVL